MDSVDNQKTKLNEKDMETQAIEDKNANKRALFSTVDRLKQLENPSEARSLTDLLF